MIDVRGSTCLYCKNCGGSLTPKLEILTTDDPYYLGGARCGGCNFLYFPDYPPTWNCESWRADFDRKAEVILRQEYEKNDWRKDVYLALHFIDQLTQMATWYFSSPEFGEHDRLLGILDSLGAAKSVDTLRRAIELAKRPEQVRERFGLLGAPSYSELIDDAWEEVTGELAESLDPDLRQLVYDRFMRDHDCAEFSAE